MRLTGLQNNIISELYLKCTGTHVTKKMFVRYIVASVTRFLKTTLLNCLFWLEMDRLENYVAWENTNFYYQRGSHSFCIVRECFVNAEIRINTIVCLRGFSRELV